MNYFITAIGTDSGKTLASAIVAKALNADYWKPIQSGQPTDSNVIRTLTPEIKIHKEAYSLNLPASPHAAAEAEHLTISLDNIKVPKVNNPLVIEGAGGILVPLNDNDTMADLISRSQAEVILVSNLYLGSINHTLLTLEALKSRKLNLKGIIFNGLPNPASEEIILKKTDAPVLLRIKEEKTITPETVKKYAGLFKKRWDELGY